MKALYAKFACLLGAAAFAIGCQSSPPDVYTEEPRQERQQESSESATEYDSEDWFYDYYDAPEERTLDGDYDFYSFE